MIRKPYIDVFPLNCLIKKIDYNHLETAKNALNDNQDTYTINGKKYALSEMQKDSLKKIWLEKLSVEHSAGLVSVALLLIAIRGDRDIIWWILYILIEIMFDHYIFIPYFSKRFFSQLQEINL